MSVLKEKILFCASVLQSSDNFFLARDNKPVKITNMHIDSSPESRQPTGTALKWKKPAQYPLKAISKSEDVGVSFYFARLYTILNRHTMLVIVLDKRNIYAKPKPKYVGRVCMSEKRNKHFMFCRCRMRYLLSKYIVLFLFPALAEHKFSFFFYVGVTKMSKFSTMSIQNKKKNTTRA